MKTMKQTVNQYKKDVRFTQREWDRIYTAKLRKKTNCRELTEIIIETYGMPDDCQNLSKTDIVKKCISEIKKTINDIEKEM